MAEGLAQGGLEHAARTDDAPRGHGLVRSALLNRLSMGLALGVLVMSFVLPAGGLGVPLCWFKALWGLPCPGCGMTRSLIRVSHGEIGEALYYHPFGPLVWGLVVALAAAIFIGEERRRRFGEWLDERARGARRVYLAFVFAFTAFGVVRLALAAALPGWFAEI